MSGYRRVNYYELCRLCTSSEGVKVHIFREEGRRRQLPTKIQICLPLQIHEEDSLPKIICSTCVDKIESFYEFRESCINAEAMLDSYFTSMKYSEDLAKDGKVYVKDETTGGLKMQSKEELKVIQETNGKSLNDGLNSLVQAAGIATIIDEAPAPQQHQQQQQQQQHVIRASAAALQYNRAVAEATDARDSLKEHEQAIAAVVQEMDERGSKRSVSEVMSLDPNIQIAIQQSTPITFTASQEMLMEFGFIKDKDGILRSVTTTTADDQNALARSSIAQIGEFLKMKTVIPVLAADGTSVIAASSALGDDDDGKVLREVVQICGRCCKTFESQEELVNHACMNTVTLSASATATPNASKKSRPGNSKGGNSELQPGGPFPCQTCGKVFRRKEHLFQHSKLHTGERPFGCTTCSKSFSRKEHLVRHLSSHTGEKLHACEMCGKSFSRKDNLLKHRKTHGIAGPFVCQTCGKSFVVKHYYQIHIASHSKEQPYVCETCGKKFAQKQYLTTHQHRHSRKQQQAGQKSEVKNEPEPSETLLVLQEEQQQQHEVQQVVGGEGQGEQQATATQVVQQIGSIISAVQQHDSHQQQQQHQLAQAYLNPSELLETYRRMNPA
ncbi:zinc finger protein 853-like isoform X2 [Neocloeon triangulifer]|uniref:zinc finger protein 853-like isoform X2 n=1 Tax=Neocloeon triangulifer TaxID=2078957 RepID=UPI00286FA144|nr:zinc finger protein 853-like isoform X2 [Neocloeon triangulifer]